MTNPLRELEALGQSVWLDDIDREYLRSGLFERLIEEDGLSGATGNPTIFEHSIDRGTAYDEQMRQLIAGGKDAQTIYETLAMTDVRHVADLLRPTYERADGQDGFVSIEVSPYLAQDTEGTLAEVRRSIEDQLSQAKAQLAALAEIGISYDQVTRQLQVERVQKFIDSFQQLFACIDRKRQVLVP